MGAPRGNCNACKGARGSAGRRHKVTHGKRYNSAAAKAWRKLSNRQRGQRTRQMFK